jgi:hypothetical protein
MTNWKTTLDIADLHQAHRAGDITIQEVAAGVAKRFKKNRFAKEDEGFQAEDIIDWLEDLAEDPNATPNDYDGVLNELYNFADWDHRIWVKTTV